jgi:disulfide bond formation protein DsbB
MTEVVITFLALLALVALGGAVLTMAVPAVRNLVAPGAAGLAWLVATVATLGSLFLSEVAGFIPCALCWVQRGFMYPLAVVLAIPAARRSSRWALGTVFWSLGGAAVAAYHYGEQHLPGLASEGFCSPALPCSTIWVDKFGFVTIPFMAFSGFVAIAVMMGVARRRRGEAA